MGDLYVVIHDARHFVYVAGLPVAWPGAEAVQAETEKFRGRLETMEVFDEMHEPIFFLFGKS